MTSPFADLVARATDENLPTENWEVNLDLCDRVSSDGESGASQALMAVTARLQQPSSKVQLYSLTLADMLGKNVPPVVIYPKLSDPALCAQLNRMVHDRANVSDEVRTRILSLIKEWDGDVSKAGHSNTLIQQTYAELKRENLDLPAETSAPDEDEELKRVLALSLQEQGGRNQWSSSSYVNNPGAGGSEASTSSSWSRLAPDQDATAAGNQGSSSDTQGAATPQQGPATTNPFLRSDGSGSTQPPPGSNPGEQLLVDLSPERATSPSSGSAQGSAAAAAAAAAALGARHPPSTISSSTPGAAAYVPGAASGVASGSPTQAEAKIVSSRVRALYDFTSSEPGELTFKAGDYIRVLATLYAHWWKGEVGGQVGIFPVNHVEILPNPTPDDLARDANLEAEILASSTVIDSLVDKLTELDAHGPVASSGSPERQELDGLYNEALTVSPKINELIDRYEAKLAELRGLKDKFGRARGRYEQATSGSGTPQALQPAPTLGTPQGASAPGVGGAGGTGGTGGVGDAGGAGGGSSAEGGHEPAPAYAPPEQQAIPQPPPGMDIASPEYAAWYYANFPQSGSAPQH